jgi:hypothetical protein
MRYLMLTAADRRTLLAELEAMPDFLAERFGALAPADAASGPADAFSPVEHCWHLADLEREGWAVRLRRLRDEDAPALPDFDGARLARERDYESKSVAAGIAAFRAARAANLAALCALAPDQWQRRGTQEGVGEIALCDLPAMMREHDAAHREEIEQWERARSR